MYVKAHELVEQRANSVLLSSGTGENHTTSFGKLVCTSTSAFKVVLAIA